MITRTQFTRPLRGRPERVSLPWRLLRQWQRHKPTPTASFTLTCEVLSAAHLKRKLCFLICLSDSASLRQSCQRGLKTENVCTRKWSLTVPYFFSLTTSLQSDR